LTNSSLLALDGGTPLLPEGPPAWPKPDPDVQAALAAAYADGSWGKYAGPHSDRLIELLQHMTGCEHAALCCSGTVAVELALRGLKIGPGHEVLLAAYDFPGNFRAIEAVGARPVLVDLEAGSWRLDVEQVEAAIHPATKAVIASHLHGSLVEMRRLREVAERRKLVIVEDACQTPGALVDGQPAGSWGDAGVFSFGGSKLLTAGRGGAVVTSRPAVLQRIKVFTERGNEAYPLSELQAAVLVPQIGKLAAANARRLANVRRLLHAFAAHPSPPAPLPQGERGAGSDTPQLRPLELNADPGNQPAFYKLPWLLTANSDDCSSPEFEQLRGRFIAAARAEGVALDEGFRGFAKRTGNRCRMEGDLPHARLAAAGTLLLHHPVLLEEEQTINRVTEAICKVARLVLARG
jgi:dTDP-4-amino-4,6-dideoxygalactose transaminase